MKFTISARVGILLLAAALPAAVTAEPQMNVSKAALAGAGRGATLRMIDYGEDYCDGTTTVEEWLKALVGRHARAIIWTGGQCVLVSDMRPGIDASSWPYCAQATVTLVHPKNSDDTPVIEIYFEKPQQGRPGAAYAFRGVLMTRDGDPDYIRFRKDFEAGWNERFAPKSTALRCKDE
jgi:hypothetical protein